MPTASTQPRTPLLKVMVKVWTYTRNLMYVLPLRLPDPCLAMFKRPLLRSLHHVFNRIPTAASEQQERVLHNAAKLGLDIRDVPDVRGVVERAIWALQILVCELWHYLLSDSTFA
eukprot:8201992-Pyramimonas_sp.AAC.1